MESTPERAILESWQRNAEAWRTAIVTGSIASRAVTDAAILAAVADYRPLAALDIGCGEGWLCRALAATGVAMTGIDATPALIAAARRQGGAGERYLQASYEAILELPLPPVDAAVCNFSLFGEQSVARLLQRLPQRLCPQGVVLIQTLHPLIVAADNYRDGWRAGSWAGLGEGFSAPAPWYFRTLSGWFKLFSASALDLLECREPLDPVSQRPLSILFVCRYR